MEGNDSLKKVWTSNRRNAYFGSRLQFMRSYYDSTLVEDGWTLGLMDEKDEDKFFKVSNPYDTTYYGAIDSSTEVEPIK